ncbi:MAG: metallophosphoesterase family protein [Alphaproteobacteria bacterium]
MSLFTKFFRRTENGRPDEYRGPADRRVYAIGDIHGRADLLVQLLERIDQDRADSTRPSEIIFLGDYIDRGEHSEGVITHCLQLKARSRTDPTIASIVFLKGNHEDAMLAFLDDPEKGAAWLSYGGLSTVQSYKADGPSSLLNSSALSELRDGLEKALPVDHLQFLKELKAYHCVGDYLFVHAAVHPSLSLVDQPDEVLYWGNEDFLRRPWKEPYMVVHGHTITELPEIRPFRIGVDTGAYYSGRLTAVCIDGADVHFLDTLAESASE